MASLINSSQKPIFAKDYFDPVQRTIFLDPLMLNCRHVFDERVINSLENNVCPLCRKKISKVYRIDIQEDIRQDVQRYPERYDNLSFEELVKRAKDEYPSEKKMAIKICSFFKKNGFDMICAVGLLLTIVILYKSDKDSLYTCYHIEKFIKYFFSVRP